MAPLAQARLIPGEDDVERPVQGILDAPMAPHGLCGSRRLEPGGGDKVAHFEAGAVGQFGARCHANEGRRVRQARLAGEWSEAKSQFAILVEERFIIR